MSYKEHLAKDEGEVAANWVHLNRVVNGDRKATPEEIRDIIWMRVHWGETNYFKQSYGTPSLRPVMYWSHETGEAGSYPVYEVPMGICFRCRRRDCKWAYHP